MRIGMNIMFRSFIEETFYCKEISLICENINGILLIRYSPMTNNERTKTAVQFFLSKIIPEVKKGRIQCHSTISYIATDVRDTRETIKKSKIFALDTSDFAGLEADGLIQTGCPLCGMGNILADAPTIQARSLVGTDFSFTDTGRMIIQHDSLKFIRDKGFTGFEAYPMSCDLPDHVYMIMIGSTVQVDKKTFERDDVLNVLMKEYKHLLKHVEIEEYSNDKLILYVSKDCYIANEFQNLYNIFLKWHKHEYFCIYTEVPLPVESEGMPACRFVWLKITGYAGIEEPYNEYHQEAKCPLCKKGGWFPLKPMHMDYNQWDGTDFSLTEKGRICISKRVDKYLKTKFVSLGMPIPNIIE